MMPLLSLFGNMEQQVSFLSVDLSARAYLSTRWRSPQACWRWFFPLRSRLGNSSYISITQDDVLTPDTLSELTIRSEMLSYGLYHRFVSSYFESR